MPSFCTCSSVERALPSEGRGRRSESAQVHFALRSISRIFFGDVRFCTPFIKEQQEDRNRFS